MLLGASVLVLVFLYWGYGQLSDPTEETQGARRALGGEPPTMLASKENPSPIGSVTALKYTLTRRDLLLIHTIASAYNRIIQIAAVAGVLIIAVFIICVARPDPLSVLIVVLVVAITAWLALFSVALALTTLATVYLLKHRGVLGEHVLELTHRGLLERTEFNETLAKWPSIYRIRSTRWFLYIYVNDLQFHVVPKRYFPRDQVAHFESQLRAQISATE